MHPALSNTCRCRCSLTEKTIDSLTIHILKSFSCLEERCRCGSNHVFWVGRTLESNTTKAECTRVWRTLDYVLRHSTSYPGVTYSRVRPTLVWRTLESMVTSVATNSRVQKFPRVRGGSYTGTPYRRVPSQKALILY